MEPEWRIGFHDNTLLGWLITAGYVVVTILCVAAAWRAAGSNRDQLQLWTVLAVGMFLLGLNKQLDLQNILRFAGRDLTRAFGIYELKFVIRAVFLALLVAAGLTAAIRWRHRYLSALLRKPALIIGLVLLAVFIALSSLHPRQIKDMEFLVVTREEWLWTLEAAGLLLVALSACVSLVAGTGQSTAQSTADERG